jgi:hypothetical protein
VAVHLFAGIPVNDYAAALAWYESLLGSPPSFFPHDTEAVWELAELRSVYILQQPEHAGHAMHTILVDDLDSLVAGIARRGWSRRSRRRTRTACTRPPTPIPTETRSGSAKSRADREPATISLAQRQPFSWHPPGGMPVSHVRGWGM